MRKWWPFLFKISTRILNNISWVDINNQKLKKQQKSHTHTSPQFFDRWCSCMAVTFSIPTKRSLRVSVKRGYGLWLLPSNGEFNDENDERPSNVRYFIFRQTRTHTHIHSFPEFCLILFQGELWKAEGFWNWNDQMICICTWHHLTSLWHILFQPPFGTGRAGEWCRRFSRASQRISREEINGDTKMVGRNLQKNRTVKKY